MPPSPLVHISFCTGTQNLNVVIPHLQFWKLSLTNGASNENVVKMATFLFQYRRAQKHRTNSRLIDAQWHQCTSLTRKYIPRVCTALPPRVFDGSSTGAGTHNDWHWQTGRYLYRTAWHDWEEEPLPVRMNVNQSENRNFAVRDC